MKTKQSWVAGRAEVRCPHCEGWCRVEWSIDGTQGRVPEHIRGLGQPRCDGSLARVVLTIAPAEAHAQAR